ncbi:hypothetical protein LY76DRAFT_285439 [Colletotrichum caudatum]|nr:hypothetical protein LY76DRAFT_285439 [Colletotrichum caudatum]
MAQPNEPRRRFAPVPIETTFESVRKGPLQQPQQQHHQAQTHNQHPGPAPEPTPEHTPRTPSPNPFEQQTQLPPPPQAQQQQQQQQQQPRLHNLQQSQPPRRRFAPQLIESSRRARRVGDAGPATRPADKTDITPYTNHIYLQRNKSRRKVNDGTSSPSSQTIQRQPKGARRESEDENAGTYMLEWAALEAERQMQEAALAAFPNSRPREGGAAHFYYRESSGDDSTPESVSPKPTDSETKPRTRHAHGLRRKSSEVGYWQKHMQKHAETLAVARGEHAPPFDDDDDVHNDSELDRMELDGPPDAMWLTNKRNHTTDTNPPKGALEPIGESFMPLIAPTQVVADEACRPELTPPETLSKPIGETAMPYIPPAAVSKPAAVNVAAPAQIVPETGFSKAGGGGFGRPFGNFGLPPETSEFRKMRKAASPPMLGKDLVFRKCPSPKQTKLEPDHPFSEVPTAEERNRDTTGEAGLWRGYCFRNSESDQAIVPSHLHGPRMLHTPLPPTTSADPFAAAFSKGSVTDEPGSHYSSATLTTGSVEHRRVRSGEAKGLHMLTGLEERLKREKALEEKIASEFDDTFITQVYNYLSLGYPAMARAFDEELSKISHMSIEELEVDDAKQMASGHLMEPAEAEMAEENRCPRWRALKAYVFEWARQHPDLDSLDPLAWGVRERRGSWAI